MTATQSFRRAAAQLRAELHFLIAITKEAKEALSERWVLCCVVLCCVVLCCVVLCCVVLCCLASRCCVIVVALIVWMSVGVLKSGERD